MRLRAVLLREALREDEVKQDDVEEGQAGGEVERRRIRNAAESSTNHRTESEAEAEGGAEHAHVFRASLRRSDIGDVSLRDGDIAAGDAGDDPRHEKQENGVRQPHEDEADRGPEKADHEHGSPAEAVG